MVAGQPINEQFGPVNDQLKPDKNKPPCSKISLNRTYQQEQIAIATRALQEHNLSMANRSPSTQS